MISPVFEQLSSLSEGIGSIGFYKVDVDSQEQISQEAGIRAVCFKHSFSFWWVEVIVVTVSQMPTFHVYHGGNKVDELVGADPGKLGVSPSIIWFPQSLTTHT